MKTLRTLAALALAGTLAAGMTACTGNPSGARCDDDCRTGVGLVDSDSDSDNDCDLDDQAEHDEDCGHYVNGVWTWYPWVSRGRYSTPPLGWRKPTTRPTAKSTTGSGTRRNTPSGTRTQKTTTGSTRTGGRTTRTRSR